VRQAKHAKWLKYLKLTTSANFVTDYVRTYRYPMNASPNYKQRKGPYTRISQFWRVVFASLLIDLALNATINPKTSILKSAAISLNAIELVAIICATCTLPFLNQNRILDLLSKLRHTQNRDRSTSSRSPLKWGVVLLVALLILAKLTLLPTLNNLLSVVFAVVFLIAALISARHLLRESSAHAKSLIASPWLYIPIWERQLVILFSIPIILARLVSVMGTLSLCCGANNALAFVATITSAILMLALRPERRSFIGLCKRCLAPAPLAYVEYGSCPRCSGSKE
jgi:hypothetical protein